MPQNLDEMIMEIEVSRRPPKGSGWNAEEERLSIKFLAIAGGMGPQFDLPESLAVTLYEKLKVVLGK